MFVKILLSIKPEYAEKILKDKKKYEFRKVLPRRYPLGGGTVIIYATRPVSKVVGEFSIEKVISDTPSGIWRKTKHLSGIEKSFFDKYFFGRRVAHAIKIRKTKRYSLPKELCSVIGSNRPPQSFCYLNHIKKI